ncbi:MAG TPA: hypothetical protein VN699_03490 [Pirellulales bacterium]|nr:hypothetical protein [Pirellulales bacterium]
MLDLSRVANAAAHLERLPEPGESIHCVMKGNFDSWDLVPAVLRLAAPATIGYLGVATLGFNARGTAELCRLMDAGQIEQVDFIASTCFQAKGAAEWAGLHTQLTARGGRCVAVRSHAKLLLFAMSDGAAYAIESSANLRSCRMAEQFCMTHDRGLFDFHHSWITHFINEATR